jgi:hypothetical protein
MSGQSQVDADTLRSWLKFTIVVHAPKPGNVAVPHAPIGMMILVKLSILPTGSATLAELRDAFELDEEETTRISHAARPLIEAGLVTKVRRRETELSITQLGRTVVGHYFRRAFPRSRT